MRRQKINMNSSFLLDTFVGKYSFSDSDAENHDRNNALENIYNKSMHVDEYKLK